MKQWQTLEGDESSIDFGTGHFGLAISVWPFRSEPFRSEPFRGIPLKIFGIAYLAHEMSQVRFTKDLIQNSIKPNVIQLCA